MKNDANIVGRQVKDMYGASIGKVVGSIVDIDGSIQLVGVYGSRGLRQIPFEQLVLQNDVVIFIPRWRLDSQRLLREKELLLRRLRALSEIVAENSDMKHDAEVAHAKYETKIHSLAESQKSVKVKLKTRLEELDTHIRALKMLIFDARVQLKSNEIGVETFEAVKMEATSIMEFISNETAEIVNVQRKIEDLDIDVAQALEKPKAKPHQYAEVETELENKLPKVPVDPISAGSAGEEEPQDDFYAKTPEPKARTDVLDSRYAETKPEPAKTKAPNDPYAAKPDAYPAESGSGYDTIAKSQDEDGQMKSPDGVKSDWLSRISTH